jgi:very-short-patch-repair endonuclease
MKEGPMRGASRELRAEARRLRREMTEAETRLWNGLRGWRLGKFRRQHPLDRLVLDFYCPAAALCVEVDGPVHDDPDQQDRDRARSEALGARGIRVLRFRNEEILADTAAVLRRIRAELAGSPLPPAGEGGASKRAG